MIVYRILIDGLPLVVAHKGQPRIEFWRDPAKMFEHIIEIREHKNNHAKRLHLDFEKIELPDESSPSKQVIKEHELFHGRLNWRRCDYASCRRLQMALASRTKDES